MKMPSAKAKVKAFTLVELLVVIFILLVVAVLLFPTGPRKSSRANLPMCMNNQKQIALAFMMWTDDHSEQFPWQVSSANGGTMEYAARGYAAPNFQVLSNYLQLPIVFICPTDKSKVAATNYIQFNNQNTSYFVAFDFGTNNSVSILTGDRNLESNGKPAKPGSFIYSANANMNWTPELHNNLKNWAAGVLSFNDGHAEATKVANLNSIFQREGLATNHLAVP